MTSARRKIYASGSRRCHAAGCYADRERAEPSEAVCDDGSYLSRGQRADVLARIIGPSLSEFLGQHVIIENVVGARGITWGKPRGKGGARRLSTRSRWRRHLHSKSNRFTGI
jgi:hypothetical protein